jgi:hypothetical protein
MSEKNLGVFRKIRLGKYLEPKDENEKVIKDN